MIHDGKFEIFSSVFRQRVKKRSKNRELGTLKTKAIQNVIKVIIRNMVLRNVLPSIMRKWPKVMCRDISIQQDNARPHLIDDDAK